MKQISLFPSEPKEHGGILAVGKRRSRRPLATKKPLHVTLKSDFAYGTRSLKRYAPQIESIIKKAERRFRVRVYRQSINATHLHLLIRGKKRKQIQNFFRVLAGHIAQQILRDHPLTASERLSRGNKGCAKNQRKFWAYLIYSRVVSWGREFRAIVAYIQKNLLESLYLIAYEPRRARAGPT